MRKVSLVCRSGETGEFDADLNGPGVDRAVSESFRRRDKQVNQYE